MIGLACQFRTLEAEEERHREFVRKYGEKLNVQTERYFYADCPDSTVGLTFRRRVIRRCRCTIDYRGHRSLRAPWKDKPELDQVDMGRRMPSETEPLLCGIESQRSTHNPHQVFNFFVVVEIGDCWFSSKSTGGCSMSPHSQAFHHARIR